MDTNLFFTTDAKVKKFVDLGFSIGKLKKEKFKYYLINILNLVNFH